MIEVYVEVTQDIKNEKSVSEQNISKDIKTDVDMNTPDIMDAYNGPNECDEMKEVDTYTVEVEMEQEKGGATAATNEADSKFKEDSDYMPIEESNTDDGLEDDELSDNDEYVQAGSNGVGSKALASKAPEPKAGASTENQVIQRERRQVSYFMFILLLEWC